MPGAPVKSFQATCPTPGAHSILGVKLQSRLTVETFATYFAPADFNETANTMGQQLYAKQEPRKFERGTDLHTQSNPLPMCHRPGVLVKLAAG